MYRCLGRTDTSLLLAKEHGEAADIEAELLYWIDMAENWQDELGVITYVVAGILMGRVRDGKPGDGFLKCLYRMPDTMWLDIEEVDSSFVSFLLLHRRDRRLSLEDQIVALQERRKSYRYKRNHDDSTLRARH